MSAKICQCCGGTGWEGSKCSEQEAKLLELQRAINRVREFISVLNVPLVTKFEIKPEFSHLWEGVDPDKWLETLRGHDTPETEVDL